MNINIHIDTFKNIDMNMDLEVDMGIDMDIDIDIHRDIGAKISSVLFVAVGAVLLLGWFLAVGGALFFATWARKSRSFT